MSKYPKTGEEVRVKNETGLHIAIQRWNPHHVELDDGRILPIQNIITRHQKTVLVYVIQIHYGGKIGWEDVTEAETFKEARDDRRAYRENQDFPVRLIRRREPNDLYQEGA